MKNKSAKEMVERISIGKKRVFFMPGNKCAVVDERIEGFERLTTLDVVSVSANQLNKNN